ncbi:MAG: hypothetical protein DRR42_20740, partial [Gammaproteobacteria bacterium]
MISNHEPGKHLVSVVLAAYNCEDYICQAIDSLLDQTYDHLEIIIADDASTDATRGIIDSYQDERIRREHNEKNLGYLATCNKLLNQCSGKYIIFQDADDWSELTRIEILSKMMEKDDKLFAVGSSINKVDEQSVVVGTRHFPATYEDAFKCMADRGKAACVGSVMFRKEILSTVGVYREFFNRQCFEDVDWLFRVMEQYRFVNYPTPLYNYRNNPNSVTSIFTDEKIVMREIVHILGTQRRESGTDMLMQGRVTELGLIKERVIHDLLRTDPFHFYLVRLNRSIINRNAHEFRSTIWNMMRRKFYHPKAYAILAIGIMKY